MDHPVTGGQKYRDLVLQVGGWTQGWQPNCIKILLLQNPKKWKVDSSKHEYSSILVVTVPNLTIIEQ
jgi:hypothetical protein